MFLKINFIRLIILYKSIQVLRCLNTLTKKNESVAISSEFDNYSLSHVCFSHDLHLHDVW